LGHGVWGWAAIKKKISVFLYKVNKYATLKTKVYISISLILYCLSAWPPLREEQGD